MAPVPTILVIDDDPDLRDYLRMVLEDHGYRVVTACDGQEGLKCALAERPHLILCDMMMPKMSGFIVLERIKQHPHLRMPFVMLTGNVSDQQRAFAEFLGADAYLIKPVGSQALIQELHRFCPISVSAPVVSMTMTPIETLA